MPTGISFVNIDPKTGLASADNNTILEPFILGTEPFNDNINIIDGIMSIKNKPRVACQ